jgi:putative two-component system response regulator
MEKAHILVVDDEAFNLSLLQDILEPEYTVSIADSGEEALRRAHEQPEVILLDIMMPGMSGYDVCQRLKSAERTRHIPVIFITSRGYEEDETRGFAAGAVDYITKPVKPAIVRARVRTHLELSRARKQLEQQNTLLEVKVKARTQELSQSRLEIVHRLVFVAEYRDPETGSHIQRMSHYTAALTRAYGLSEKVCEIIRFASPMHDIGKIGIPDSILLKPGKLTSEEWDIMKTHTTIGGSILSNSRSTLLRSGRIIALGHHERWDGTGYPLGLQGKAIPLLARITTIADIFDALTTRRPYKEAWSVEDALADIYAVRGVYFDPELVDLLEQVLPEFLDIKARFSQEK